MIQAGVGKCRTPSEEREYVGVVCDPSKAKPVEVKPGEAGSRVIFWAHGSAYAIMQAKDFVWSDKYGRAQTFNPLSRR